MPGCHVRKMSTKKRVRSDDTPERIRLSGGVGEKPRTVDKYRTGAHTDVTLRAGCGTTIRAHKLCLMGASDFMETLFTGEWSETAQGTIELPDMSMATLKACLEFIYTGGCVLDDDAALADVLEAAVYLQMPALKQAPYAWASNARPRDRSRRGRSPIDTASPFCQLGPGVPPPATSARWRRALSGCGRQQIACGRCSRRIAST